LITLCYQDGQRAPAHLQALLVQQSRPRYWPLTGAAPQCPTSNVATKSLRFLALTGLATTPARIEKPPCLPTSSLGFTRLSPAGTACNVKAFFQAFAAKTNQ